MSQGFVIELSPTDKVPGVYLQTLYGQGDNALGAFQRYLLVVGLTDQTNGTIVEDDEVVDIFSAEDSALYFGPGAEGDRMCRAALRAPGVKIKAAAPSISGAAAATAIIRVGGTWTVAGKWTIRVGGIRLSQGILKTYDKQDVAEAIAAYINAREELPVTAAAAAGTGGNSGTWEVTLTAKSPGDRGNDLIVWQDTSGNPSGMTSVLVGGAAVGNGGLRFSGGTGTEDITNLLGTLYEGRYDRIAAAQRDSTNLGLWRDQLDNKAGPLEGRMEHAIFATSDTFSAATSLAQTDLDEQRAQMLWMKDSETPPPELAAEHASRRLQAEQSNPNSSYDNQVLTGAAPQTDKGTNPNRAQQVAALDVGLTPLKTVNGKVLVVRAITTRSLTETGAIDDSTLDVAEAVVPDAVRDIISAYWQNSFVTVYKHVRDDPTADEPTPPDDTAYPALWTAEVTNIFKQLEQQSWITHVDQNPVRSSLHPQVARIVFYAPVVVLPTQHQIEGTIAQTRFKAAA